MIDFGMDSLVPPLPKWLFPSCAAACLIVFGLYGRSCYLRHKASDAVSQANTHGTEGAINAASGAIHDQAADSQAQALRDSDAEVARLRGEVARLRKATIPVPAPPVAPPVPDPQPVVPAPDLRPLLAKQDELIQAQGRQNDGLKATVVTLTAARDSWRQSAGDYQREAASLRIAHEAQLAALKTERWKGRFEGFAVGLAGGYITGRLR